MGLASKFVGKSALTTKVVDDVGLKKIPISNAEAYDLSYNKYIENGLSPEKAKSYAQREVDSFQGQIYKQEVNVGDEFIVNHTGEGQKPSGTFVIDKSQANKTSSELQTELALPNSNNANAQTKIIATEKQTILSGTAADKSSEPWAWPHATGGGEQKVINPQKTDINEIFK